MFLFVCDVQVCSKRLAQRATSLFSLWAGKQTSICTLTNQGYIDLTLNLIESLQKVGLVHTLTVYCLDEVLYQTFQKAQQLKGFHTYFINTNIQNREISIFGTSIFTEMVFYKFVAIQHQLQNPNHHYVLFTDGDVVFERSDVLTYLHQAMDSHSHDMVIQNDTLHDQNSRNMCTGFFMLRNCEKVRKSFHPEYINRLVSTTRRNKMNDQELFNSYVQPAAQLDIHILPVSLFPNGAVYMKRYKSLHPYIIHFIWISGKQKINKMREFNKWYVS